MRFGFSSSSDFPEGAALGSLAGGAPFGGAPLAGGALAALGSLAGSSFLRVRSLTSFTIASSSSVSYSPFLRRSCRTNFSLDLFAFSALPASFVSHDAFKAFSLSSLSVSLTTARVSLLNTFMYQEMS